MKGLKSLIGHHQRSFQPQHPPSVGLSVPSQCLGPSVPQEMPVSFKLRELVKWFDFNIVYFANSFFMDNKLNLSQAPLYISANFKVAGFKLLTLYLICSACHFLHLSYLLHELEIFFLDKRGIFRDSFIQAFRTWGL